ncbi:hypothetical protein PIROE2DRAFT_19394 [Piromyces sp. E2]|nr:hypothetical protein PIROE2DRAFT_19394 [Piromyces sp. E2]|eukprot:OUM56140.1 hypothetical protein PIROE2DRAFT_19394 [Piromyces sp. E2]
MESTYNSNITYNNGNILLCRDINLIHTIHINTSITTTTITNNNRYYYYY